MQDFLLNPNLAYLALVLSAWLALLAVLTPGTGLFEVAALFALLLAGWGVYNLPVNLWALGLLGLGGLALVLALRSKGRFWWLGLAILALLVGSAFLFRAESGWQPAVHPLLAGVVSLLSSGFFWLGGRKAMEAARARPAHNLQLILGELGEARTEIREQGSVQVAGELWSARSEHNIPAGSQVRVIGRDGFTLLVEEARNL
jgi:membrane-bound ClpP family serine protease